MKNNFKYLIVRDRKYNKMHFLHNKIDGYILIGNKKKKISGMTINNMIVVDKNLIEKTINKKIERKFKLLLEFIADIDENDDSSNGMIYALNEIEKFRRMIFNEYIFYMNKNQLEKLEKKIKIIEKEVKMRLYQYEYDFKLKAKEEMKSTHHRR